MATPHVAGIASLMLSVNPSLTPAQVLAIIQTTARAFPTGTGRDCTTALCGAGIINAAAAVLAAASAAAGPTTTTLTSSANPAASGASVAFTATVTGTTPSGTVNFADGGTSLAGCAAVALTGSGNTRTATCSTSALTVGSHSIVASYGGDAGNAASSSAPVAQVVNAKMLANGGFETPALAGTYRYAPTGASWVFSGGSGITGNATGFTSGNPAAPEGVQVGFLQNGNSQVAQTINLAAGPYTLSLQAAQRGNHQRGSQLVLVQVDGVTVGQYQPPNTSYTSYTTPAFTIASAGTHTIALLGAGGGGTDFTAFVDNVRLTMTGSATTTLTSLANPSFAVSSSAPLDTGDRRSALGND